MVTYITDNRQADIGLIKQAGPVTDFHPREISDTCVSLFGEEREHKDMKSEEKNQIKTESR